MREKQVEARLVRRAREHGGRAEKFTSPGRKNVPDRIVLLPGGRMFFVEVKAPGEDASKAQQRDHAKRRKLGFATFVVDTYEAVEALPWGGTVHG